MDVIVNADDLGSSPDVNNAIFDLMAEGLVTSATIIANAPHVEEACQEISRFPHCSFGVHLNVTEFAPLSDAAGLGRLLDGNGAFDGERVREAGIDQSVARGIFEEFCAQIEKLAALGVQVSHIDSHHHIHTIPKAFPILKKVQKRFGIRRARLTRNIYGPGERVTIGLRLKKASYNFMLKHHYRTATTDGFSDFMLFFQRARSQKMRQHSVEVMVHPGSRYYDSDETELLRGPWRDAIGFPIRLISYADL